MGTFQQFFKVMADDKITPSGKLVWMYLDSRSNHNLSCYPAVNTIEKETGMCERTVQRQTNALDERGHITKMYRKAYGRQYTNRYYLNPAAQEDIYLTRDCDIRNKIYEDDDFQSFLGQEEQHVTRPYKKYAIRYVFRNLTLKKEEKLLLCYFLYRADQEAFTYFSVGRLSQIIGLSVKKIKSCIRVLRYKKLITCFYKIMNGESIVLAKINLKRFGLDCIIDKKPEKMIRAFFLVSCYVQKDNKIAAKKIKLQNRKYAALKRDFVSALELEKQTVF